MIVPALLAGTVVSAVSVVGLTTMATADRDAGRDADADGLRIPCGAVWDRLPADLRDDLAAVRDLPGSERPEALAGIRDDALAGEYGAEVAAGAQRIQERRADVFAQLPADLQDDIEAVRALPPGERADAAREVRDGAVAGEYGERVQSFAERLQHRREVCRG